MLVAGTPSTVFTGAAIATSGVTGVPDAVTAAESDEVARIVVSRTGGRGVANVEYDVTAETASAGTDVAVASGTVTFEDGERSTTIEIPLVDDTAAEGPETFRVQLARPGGQDAAPAPDRRSQEQAREGEVAAADRHGDPDRPRG